MFQAATLLKIAGLINKYGSRSPSSLTEIDIKEIALAIHPQAVISPESISVAREIIASPNVDAVADLLARPELVTKLTAAFKPPPPVEVINKLCTGCFKPFVITLTSQESMAGSAARACPHCGHAHVLQAST